MEHTDSVQQTLKNDSPSRSIPGRHYMPAAKEFAAALSVRTIGSCKDRLHDSRASLPAAKS
jgi:hypothetical protein